jgi:Zn finger protein HypA/HybF involved in hydrogenase expression
MGHRMKKGTLRHFFSNPYISGIVVGIVLLFVSSLYASWTAKIDLLKGFLFVVTFGVPIWILVAILLLCLVVSRVLTKRPSAYMRYVREEIEGRMFCWRWQTHTDGRITLADLQRICPHCECTLLELPPNTWCPRCHKAFDHLPMSKEVEIQGIIIGNARRRFRNNNFALLTSVPKTHDIK